jgi:hypothetical protein
MLTKILSKLSALMNLPSHMDESVELIREALGRLEARSIATLRPGDLEAAEFKVFSQWGEDGILEHLISHISIPNKIFVEFGVQDYREANTRFLLTNRNWSGLVIDGSAQNIAFIKQDSIYWRFNLKAERVFLTRENIDESIVGQGISGDIGLLSIDIDGNDYWVWEAISCVAPRIVVAEYNALFGSAAPVSVPYDPAFQRNRAHYSNLYWGCSLAALVHLGQAKGYVLVGCNSAGNNAFFVRKDLLGQLPAREPSIAFRPAKFRESRKEDGSLSYLNPASSIEVIKDLLLIDVVTGDSRCIADVLDSYPIRASFK